MFVRRIMGTRQLHESQHYRRSFFTACSALFGQRSSERTLPQGVSFADMVLFFPLLGASIGFIVMVSGMIGAYFFKSSLIAAALGLVLYFLATRTFYSAREKLSLTVLDVSFLLLAISLMYTAYERHAFLVVMLSITSGLIAAQFACGLGKDLVGSEGISLCSTYKNEDYFLLFFTVVMVALMSIVTLKNLWYVGLIGGLLIPGACAHLIAQAQGGVTLQGIKRAILYATIAMMALLMILQ